MIEQQDEDGPRYIDARLMPIYAESARTLVAEGGLTSTAKAQEVSDTFVREGRSENEIFAIFDIAFSIARQVNSVLLSASAKYGATLKVERKIYGNSAPEIVEATREAERIEAEMALADVVETSPGETIFAAMERIAQARTPMHPQH